MKKSVRSIRGKLLAAVGVVSVFSAVFCPIGTLAAANTAEQYIGEIKAKSIALEHAGVTEQQATFLKVHLDYDDQRVVYDVEFFSGSTEYDYEIDATAGDILEYDKDIDYYSIPNSASASSGADQYIGESEARSIALNHAQVKEESAFFIKAYLDYDDGCVDYDVEFYVGDIEYEYEIDAASGSILEYDHETKKHHGSGDNSDTSKQSSPQATLNAAGDTYIGEAAAKSAALNHAGVAESQTRKMKVKLDREHGTMVYEVEFKSGQMEYEYEINAANAAILESDVEYDD